MISNNSLIVSDRVNEVPKKCFPVNSDEKLEHCRLVSADVSMMQGTNVPTNTAHPMTGTLNQLNIASAFVGLFMHACHLYNFFKNLSKALEMAF